MLPFTIPFQHSKNWKLTPDDAGPGSSRVRAPDPSTAYEPLNKSEVSVDKGEVMGSRCMVTSNGTDLATEGNGGIIQERRVLLSTDPSERRLTPSGSN